MTVGRFLLPSGVDTVAGPLLVGRALRAFSDGYIAVLLPAYLLALGFDQFDVGLLSTATLAGSALATLAVGTIGHRWSQHALLVGAALLMLATGLGFASVTAFWPLLVVAFVGTINPGSGDVSVFLPLEHALLARAASGDARTALFARYSLTGSLMSAFGALASGVPAWLMKFADIPPLVGMRAMFVLYALIGALIWVLYRRLPRGDGAAMREAAPLGPSRGVVYKLAALFSLDSFAGGLVVQSLLALWLFQRFDLSLSAASLFFFWTSVLTAFSYPIAARLSARIGLINTMVFTHIPSSIFLIIAAFSPDLMLTLGLLLARSALAQMDVPARSSYVMAVVTPAERTAAASVTAVPRSLASSLGPALAGMLLATPFSGLPLVACGALKIAYDLALLYSFRHVKPPEEA